MGSTGHLERGMVLVRTEDSAVFEVRALRDLDRRSENVDPEEWVVKRNGVGQWRRDTVQVMR